MFDLDNWKEIWSTITSNKTRSFFTGFGVFWGILMYVILIGFGNSMKGGFNRNLEGFDSNSIFFIANRTSEAYKGFKKGRTWNMTNKDVDLIRRKASTVEFASPVIFKDGLAKNVTRGQKSGTYSSRGVYADHFKIEGMTTLKGRLFNDLDDKDSRKVCLIGTEVEKTLFNKGENPIGQYIKVNGIYFQIIGVIEAKSVIQIGGPVASTVFLPFTTMQRAYSMGNEVHTIACSAQPNVSISVLQQQVEDILRQEHSISPTDKKAMFILNVEEQMNTFKMLFLGTDVVILIVGLGALFSGIIGISNIMLVTVKERTREIGVRRALGASPMRILVQIMSESFVLTTIAGFLGFVFGVGVLELISLAFFADSATSGFLIAPHVTFGASMFAMVILMVSAVVAGFMPAMRALQIKAIDAIRDE